MPALLFRLMSDFSRLPRVDARMLVAYFGGCLVVYVVGRLVAATLFRHGRHVASRYSRMGGIFSNNVLLGMPIAKVDARRAALPAVSLILVFNSLILWTLVTVSVEWARHRELSARGLLRRRCAAWSSTRSSRASSPARRRVSRRRAAGVVDRTLSMVSQAAVPLSLIVARHGARANSACARGWRESGAIAALKLVAQPAVVYGLPALLALPPLATAAVVMLRAARSARTYT